MNAYLTFHGKTFQLESFLVVHQKGGDPSSAKGKGSVEPLKVGVITARIKYASTTEPAPIKTLIEAAFNKSSGTSYEGFIDIHSSDDDTKSKIEFKKAQIFNYSESGDSGAQTFTIEITIMAQELTHHGVSIKFEEGKSVS